MAFCSLDSPSESALTRLEDFERNKQETSCSFYPIRRNGSARLIKSTDDGQSIFGRTSKHPRINQSRFFDSLLNEKF